MNLEQEIELLKQRNYRVDADKAWEVSYVRRLFISLVTYVVAAVWLLLINDSNPWQKAFVPVLGYLLSTLSLSIIKNWWIDKNGK